MGVASPVVSRQWSQCNSLGSALGQSEAWVEAFRDLEVGLAVVRLVEDVKLFALKPDAAQAVGAIDASNTHREISAAQAFFGADALRAV